MDSYRLDIVLACFAGLPFLVPLAVGSCLLYLYRTEHDRLYLMAGLLTLKPIVTTPIWFLILMRTDPAFGSPSAACLSVLPGAILTALTMIAFWRLCFGREAALAWTLLAFDSARWINSYLYVFTSNSWTAILGLALPTLYALLASVVLALRAAVHNDRPDAHPELMSNRTRR